VEGKSNVMDSEQLAHQERLDGFALFAQVSVSCHLRAWAWKPHGGSGAAISGGHMACSVRRRLDAGPAPLSQAGV
jgi:hypothetical protein